MFFEFLDYVNKEKGVANIERMFYYSIIQNKRSFVKSDFLGIEPWPLKISEF